MRKIRIVGLLLALLVLLSGCSYQDELQDTYIGGTDEATDFKTSSSEQKNLSPTLKAEDSLESEPVSIEDQETAEWEITETELPAETEPETQMQEKYVPVYGENYYDLENVVLYLKEYSELPPNYITKDEAKELGWSGGSVEDYKEGAAIGGDSFGNYEGLLPETAGVKYIECDIDTDGYSSRGSRRLVYSSNGHYYYTDDHYETFKEVFVGENNEVTVEE